MKLLKNFLVVLAVAGLILATIQPCWAGGRYHGGYHHGRGGGIGTGAAIGIGLGALTLGTVIGVAASQPPVSVGRNIQCSVCGRWWTWTPRFQGEQPPSLPPCWEYHR